MYKIIFCYLFRKVAIASCINGLQANKAQKELSFGLKFVDCKENRVL